jgi:hypothetical protein
MRTPINAPGSIPHPINEPDFSRGPEFNFFELVPEAPNASRWLVFFVDDPGPGLT